MPLTGGGVAVPETPGARMMKLSQLRMPPPAAPPPPKLSGRSLTLSPVTFMLCSAFSVLQQGGFGGNRDGFRGRAHLEGESRRRVCAT